MKTKDFIAALKSIEAKIKGACFTKQRRGVATIEAAGMISIVLTMVFVGYAVGVQAFHASTTADILERVVNDTQVKPFKIAEAYTAGPDALVVDQVALNQFINSASAAGFAELQQTLGGNDLGASNIGVEAGFMILGVDTTTGAITGIQGYQISTAGGLAIEANHGALAGLQGVAAGTSAPSDFAVLAGTSYGGSKYLPYAVVGAIAAQIKEESVERKMLSLIGMGADLYQRKIISLRGDVS